MGEVEPVEDKSEADIYAH